MNYNYIVQFENGVLLLGLGTSVVWLYSFSFPLIKPGTGICCLRLIRIKKFVAQDG